MDFQPDMYKPQTPDPNRRSEMMALASVILGSIALLTSCCLYISMVCGALGIILALLSKGGSMTMNTQGKVGLTLSSIGLGLTIFFYLMMFVSVFSYYGGIDGVLQEYMNLYGVDTIEELYQIMGIY